VIMDNTQRLMVVHRQPGETTFVLTHPVAREGLHMMGFGTDDRPTNCLIVQRLYQRMGLHNNQRRMGPLRRPETKVPKCWG